MSESYETDVNKLITLYQECVDRPNAFFSDRKLNREARYCWWEGKTADGRRWTPKEKDKEVLPWKGASDMTVPMVDTYCNQDIALLNTGLMRMRLLATGLETHDISFGARVSNLLRWLIFNQMTERNREQRFLANAFVEDGKAVLGVFWDRQVQMGYEEITMAMVQRLAELSSQDLQSAGGEQGRPAEAGTTSPGPDGPGPSGLAQGAEPTRQFTAEEQAQLAEAVLLPQMIMDPAREQEAAAKIQEWAAEIVRHNFKTALGEYEDQLLEGYELKAKRARSIARELREKGRAQIPVPSVTRNRPTIVALRLDEDFFVPPDASDLENARGMFWREWTTAEELKERVVSTGYDEGWVKYVILNCKGKGSPEPTSTQSEGNPGVTGWEEHGQRWLDASELYGIVHGYEKRCNEDGVPGIYYTVFHPDASARAQGKGNVLPGGGQAYAKTCLLDYPHPDYPFIYFRREHLSRRVDDSRGYGEIAFSGQMLLKQEADLEVDRSWLTTVPPLHHPRGRPPSQWGPGAKVGAGPREYFYADTPKWDPGSKEVRALVMELWDRYFARAGKDGSNALFAQIQQQDLMDNWLDGWRLALMQMFQLCQQYLPNEFYYRIVGSDQGRPIKTSRAEIQGKFDLTIGFNTWHLSPEHLKELLAALKEIAQTLDLNGRIDRDRLVMVALEWLDPNLPEMLIRPGEEASQAEIEDEQNVFARMWAGLDQDVKPAGQAWGLRLQVLQDILMGTDEKGEPKNPEGRKKYEEDENFRKRIDKRMQQLHFQVEQRTTNPMKGILGG